MPLYNQILIHVIVSTCPPLRNEISQPPVFFFFFEATGGCYTCINIAPNYEYSSLLHKSSTLYSVTAI